MSSDIFQVWLNLCALASPTNSCRQTPVNRRCFTVSAFTRASCQRQWKVNHLRSAEAWTPAQLARRRRERRCCFDWARAGLRFKEPRARSLLEDRVSEGKRKSEREAWAYPGQERIAEGLTLFLSQFFSLPSFPFLSLSQIERGRRVTKVSQSFEVTGVQMRTLAQCLARGRLFMNWSNPVARLFRALTAQTAALRSSLCYLI